MTKNTSTQNWALSYAEAGFAVIPCAGKKPLTEHGCFDATTNPEIIERWWAQFPNANIGLCCRADFMVLDFDVKYTYSEMGIITGVVCDGIADREHLSKMLGPLPHCPRSITGSGNGEHSFFVTPNVRLPGQTRVGGTGIDIRIGNQYVIVEPSIHPDSGKRYEWLHPLIVRRKREWTKAPLPNLPRSWVDWLFGSTEPQKPRREVVRPDFRTVMDRILADLKKRGRRHDRILLGNFAEVKAKAAGKWTAILEYLCPGIVPDPDSPNRWQACPLCRKPAKFKLFDDFDQSGTCICYSCHPQGGDGISTVAWLFDIESMQALNMVDLAHHTGQV